jgi:hypothetical protein
MARALGLALGLLMVSGTMGMFEEEAGLYDCELSRAAPQSF